MEGPEGSPYQVRKCTNMLQRFDRDIALGCVQAQCATFAPFVPFRMNTSSNRHIY